MISFLRLNPKFGYGPMRSEFNYSIMACVYQK